MRLLIALLLIYVVDANRRLCEAEGTCRQCADTRYSYYRCVQQEDCFLGEVCDRGFCCPNLRPIIGIQSDASRSVHRTAPDPRSSSTSLSTSTAEAEELCPDESAWSKRCRLDDDCHPKHEICAEGKCCATCARRRRLVLDESAQNELLGLAIPQCEQDGKWYRRRQCLAGTEACWCVTALGRRFAGGGPDCETRRRKQENMVLKAVKLRDELMRGKVCDEYREGDCPTTPDENTTTALQCLCDSDCPKTWKCCEHRKGLICQAPVPSMQSLTLICGMNEQFSACHTPCQPSCDDPTLIPCPPPTCVPGCHCQPGELLLQGWAVWSLDGQDSYALTAQLGRHVYHVLHVRCTTAQLVAWTSGGSTIAAAQLALSAARRGTRQDVTKAVCPDASAVFRMCSRMATILYIHGSGRDSMLGAIQAAGVETAFVAQEESARTRLEKGLQGFSCSGGGRAAIRHRPINDPPPYRLIVVSEWLQKTLSEFYPTPGSPTVLPDTNHCSDPLKNYLNCGTKCPVGCNNLNPSTTCSLACVSGCFCRSPYVLVDAKVCVWLLRLPVRDIGSFLQGPTIRLRAATTLSTRIIAYRNVPRSKKRVDELWSSWVG
ncbi:unnamed protein product [Heligmosomoides polygyrus]|uniref:Thyroglobulin type-1 domain-containing protein n=1 Tax=Heligmosomoides polygyrus TaxID=6339 RepID=A0A3P7ZN19_HELPZ|nr:unnamed protein product [Heligmosomoides polygyrus]